MQHERVALAAARPALLVVAVVFLGYTWPATKLYDNYLKVPVLLIVPLVVNSASRPDAVGAPRRTVTVSPVASETRCK